VEFNVYLFDLLAWSHRQSASFVVVTILRRQLVLIVRADRPDPTEGSKEFVQDV
jgi:hypothetical protein